MLVYTIPFKVSASGNESAGFIKFNTNCTCHSANAILQPWISCQGRPFTDYPMLCDLDESKGLDIGMQYRTYKKAAEFANFIAKAENDKIAQGMKDVRFISAISDGSGTTF
jgi:hypothetical protein